MKGFPGFKQLVLKTHGKGVGGFAENQDVRRKPVIFSSFSDLYYKGRYAGRFGFKIKKTGGNAENEQMS